MSDLIQLSLREQCFLCNVERDNMYMFHDINSNKVVTACVNHASSESWEFTNPNNFMLDREGNLIVDVEYNSEFVDNNELQYVFYSAVKIMTRNGECRYFCTYDIPELIELVQSGDGDLI